MDSSDIVGIDLGTTNSCVAVYGRFPQAGRVYEELGVTVLADPHGPPGVFTVPSVVLVSEDGGTIVGHTAKNAMGMGNEPIAFAKRFMGTDKVFERWGRSYTPVDVSAIILRHLLDVAASRLGDPPRRAIVTVPARFTTTMKRDTQQAGTVAGIEVVEVFLEPWASALAALGGENIQDGWVFVYDFGGGTFDAAVMEFKEGRPVQPFSDGDPYLGGYDIDRALAQWVIELLEARGYEFGGLDTASNAAHRAVFDRLCYLCEGVKKMLSDREEAPLVLAGQSVMDLAGRDVVEVIQVTRQDLEDLITDRSWQPDRGDEPKKVVDRTILHCRRALEKAGIDASKVSHVILVGGSSYIPVVQERVAEFFGREPILFEPDLSVAIGAAIRSAGYLHTAASRGQVVLSIDGSFPLTTSESKLTVSGRVQHAPEGSSVVLVRDDGTTVRCPIAKDGAFAATDVPLRESDKQTYTVQVVDQDDNVVVQQEIEVVHRADVGKESGEGQGFISQGYATEPYYIHTARGPKLIAPEGTPLPFEFEQTFRTYTTGEFLWVPVYEGPLELCVLRIEGLQDLPPDSLVTVRVTLAADYELTAVAEVPGRAKRQEVTAEVKRPVVDRQELAAMFAELSQKARSLVQELQALGHMDRAVYYGPKVEQAIRSIEELSRQPGNIEPALARKTSELAVLVGEMQRVTIWTPSQSEFQAKLEQIDEMIQELAKAGKAVDGERRSRDELSKRAEDAYKEGDLDNWRHANQQLSRLLENLQRRLVDLIPRPSTTQTTGQLKEAAKQHIDELLGAFKRDPEAAAAYNQAIEDIDGIPDDTPLSQAQSRIGRIVARAETMARRAEVRKRMGDYPEGAIPVWEGAT